MIGIVIIINAALTESSGNQDGLLTGVESASVFTTGFQPVPPDMAAIRCMQNKAWSASSLPAIIAL